MERQDQILRLKIIEIAGNSFVDGKDQADDIETIPRNHVDPCKMSLNDFGPPLLFIGSSMDIDVGCDAFAKPFQDWVAVMNWKASKSVA